MPMLGLESDPSTLPLLLEGVAFVYETAAYSNLKSAALGQALLQAGLTEAAAVAVVGAWTAESAALIGRLRSRLLGGGQDGEVLLGTSWRLTLGMGDTSAAGKGGGVLSSSSAAGVAAGAGGGAGAGAGAGAAVASSSAPAATVDFVVGAAAAGDAADASGGPRAVSVEFTQGQLLDFLSKLDVIQQQLDALS